MKKNLHKDDIEQEEVVVTEQLAEIAGVKNQITHPNIVNEAEEYVGGHKNINET